MARTTSIISWVQLALVVGIVVILGILAFNILTHDPFAPKTELERAQFAAEEAVRANPESAISRIKLAAAYVESGSPSAALEQADIAIRLQPDEPAGYYVKGLALMKLNRNEDAIEALTKSVETKGQLAPFYQDAWVALSRAQEGQGLDEEALASMNRAVNYGPENVLLLYERGALYERLENWEFAMEDYAAAMEYVPNYEPAITGLARLKEAHPDVFEMLQERYSGDAPTTDSSGD